MSSKLLIQEPPLQVLPSLALAIGLNEAIVLQQLHYLLLDPRFGKRIAEHQWIFNTFEEWRASYFPFWSIRTIKTVFTNLAKLKLIESCQPEGRVSRRKYYRIDEAGLDALADRAKFVPSIVQNSSHRNVQNSSLPYIAKTTTETTRTKTTKKTKGTTAGAADDCFPSIPSREEFWQFIADGVFPQLGFGKRPRLYEELVEAGWKDGKGLPIHNWKSFVEGLDETMSLATARDFSPRTRFRAG